ncbi:hypothetical protein GC102_14870 [Paenibacillus sp. LMG 31460]|uniref:Copper amine oxidase N-terminal domain-containing protein n=1 Tax=Paenibacillus germinis TaxID=2654979 RepID=A0ABX1Z564_9BACL|nr:NPCBM/NEW2 domain-containing protein [Paenibacillus germinis]NOU87053.1 hypothetical protein [Paenibacillus germinis]
MKKISATVLATVTLSMGVCIGGYAQANIETIQAFLNHEIKFTLNGQAWTPKDPDGRELSPIIFEGSSYVPLRAMGELSGLNVNWDSATKTIILKNSSASPTGAEPYKDSKDYGKPSEMQVPTIENDSNTTYSTFNVHTDTSTPEYKEAAEQAEKVGGIYLTDLKYEKITGTNVLKRVNIDASFRDEKLHPLTKEGKVYARGISSMLDSNAQSEKITYNLDGKYSFFNTYYGVDDYTKDSKEKCLIKIYGDGKLLATGGNLTPINGGANQFIFFDVKGVNKLEISFETTFPNYSTVLALYSPKLFK